MIQRTQIITTASQFVMPGLPQTICKKTIVMLFPILRTILHATTPVMYRSYEWYFGGNTLLPLFLAIFLQIKVHMLAYVLVCRCACVYMSVLSDQHVILNGN